MEVNTEALLAALFDTIEVRSRLAPPVILHIGGDAGGQADPATDALLAGVQPAITFRGRAGEFTIAPKGMPSGLLSSATTAGPLIGLGLGAAVLGLMLLGGAVFGRK